MEWINHNVAIITTIPSTRHRTTNSTVYANSTSKLNMLSMVDTDMNWFNKQGNCSVILKLGYYHKEHSSICLEDL
jgi:hypothetical protein